MIAVRIEHLGTVHWIHCESMGAAVLVADRFPGSGIWQGLLELRAAQA